MASSSGCPDRTADLEDTRAVHSVLPPASAVTVSSSSDEPSEALAIEACSTGGASIVKIAWISVPSSSVTPTVTGNRAHEASPKAASSKSDGRMPRMILLPEVPVEAGLGLEHRRGDRQLVAGEVTVGPAVAAVERGRREVHRGGADEARHEQVDRRLEQPLRAVDLLDPAVPHTQTRSPRVIASTWSWVT